MQEKIIHGHQFTVSYLTTGSGFPVVLLHGFGEDGSIWNRQVAFLKNLCHLIIPDIPGTGKSRLEKEAPITMVDYADVINIILQEEGIEKCVMIGHSMGGYISLAFANKYPGKLIGLGLFHSSAYADDHEKIQTRKKAIEFIRVNGTEAFLKTSVPSLFYDEKIHKKDIDTLITKNNNILPETLITYYEAMIGREDHRELLENIKIPVLLLAGIHDKAIPFEYSLNQSSLAAFTKFEILRTSGHMGMIEEEEKSNIILAEFIKLVTVN